MRACPECRRRFRSASAEELYRRRKAVLESLRNGTPCAHLAAIDTDRHARHHDDNHYFRRYGEKKAA